MPECDFSEGTKRLLRSHPAFAPERTRALAASFFAAQTAVCARLAALGYPLERVAQELEDGRLPYFREGSDQDRKRLGAKKASYRFAGFAPSHREEYLLRLADRRAARLSAVEFEDWQVRFLLRFTFEMIEQVALRAFPGPVGEPFGEGTPKRGRLAESLLQARRIRDEIVEGNLLLVAKIVLQRRRIHPTASADELFAAGSDGLLIAAGRYDAEVGQFSTYATPWVTMAIDRYVAKTRHVIRLPIGLQERLRRERRDLGDHADPTRGGLIPTVQSLEEPLPGSDGELKLEDVVADPDCTAPLAETESRDIFRILSNRVEQLDDLKRFIIAMRSDVGDPAALGAKLFQEEAELSLARGRASAAAAAKTTDEPARIRMVGTVDPSFPPAAPVAFPPLAGAPNPELARAS